MTTQAQTVAGTKLYISSTLPSTQDSNVTTGFPGIATFNLIAEVTDMGELGKTYDLVTHQPVADRQKYKFKGGYDNGSMSIQMAKITLAGSDVGQAMFKTAGSSDSDYSFHIVFQDSTDMYFQGKVMGFKTKIGSLNNILGATAEIQITSDIIETV